MIRERGGEGGGGLHVWADCYGVCEQFYGIFIHDIVYHSILQTISSVSVHCVNAWRFDSDVWFDRPHHVLRLMEGMDIDENYRVFFFF